MVQNKAQEPILGSAFNDVLMELHAHVFTGVPGESDPFIMSMLVREYVAYVLSCYYQCEHCRTYHKRAVERERKRSSAKDWDWESALVRATLFLRVSKEYVSDVEWDQWVNAWRSFAGRIHARHNGLACYIAYAIGVARKDETLMDLGFTSIVQVHRTEEEVKGIIRDIDRIVIFMKAATSKNRTDPIILRQLHSRGIVDAS
jgi:hypothetical protein